MEFRSLSEEWLSELIQKTIHYTTFAANNIMAVCFRPKCSRYQYCMLELFVRARSSLIVQFTKHPCSSEGTQVIK